MKSKLMEKQCFAFGFRCNSPTKFDSFKESDFLRGSLLRDFAVERPTIRTIRPLWRTAHPPNPNPPQENVLSSPQLDGRLWFFRLRSLYTNHEKFFIDASDGGLSEMKLISSVAMCILQYSEEIIRRAMMTFLIPIMRSMRLRGRRAACGRCIKIMQAASSVQMQSRSGWN